METRASVYHHPLHPMLIVLPAGLWIFSFICSVIDMFVTTNVWHTVALYTLGGGIIGAAGAAIPGMMDLLNLPKSRARSVAVWHMLTNITVLVILTIAFFMRLFGHAEATPFVLSIIGIGLLVGGVWLGGELVYRHKVGVHTTPEPPKEEQVNELTLEQ